MWLGAATYNQLHFRKSLKIKCEKHSQMKVDDSAKRGALFKLYV